MSAFPTWKIYLDTDDDLEWDASESITARLLRVETFVGFTNPHERVAQPCWMKLWLNNYDGLYEVNDFEPPLTAGRGIRLYGEFGAVTSNRWTGFVDYTESAIEKRQVIVHCVGRWAWADGQVNLGVYPSTTADAVIEDVLRQAGFRGRLKDDDGSGVWMVGRVGQSEVGKMFVGSSARDLDLEVGETTLTYVGRSLQHPTARSVVEAVTRAEWGLFFENEDGELVFLNRHHTLQNLTIIASLDADLVEDELNYGADMVNEVAVDLVSYVVTEDVAVWTNVAPLDFRPGFTERRIRFLQADGRPYNLASDVVYSNFVFKSAPTSGTVRTPPYSVQTLSDGAIIRVQNDFTTFLYLQIGAVFTADVLTENVPTQETVTNHLSRNRYGVRALPFSMPPFASSSAALGVAHFIVGALGQPAARARRIREQNASSFAVNEQLGLKLFDPVNCLLDIDGGSDDFIIIGMGHTITPQSFVTDYYLDSFYGFWILGRGAHSELGSTTRVAY